jgi:hypothetical protein
VDGIHDDHTTSVSVDISIVLKGVVSKEARGAAQGTKEKLTASCRGLAQLFGHR